MNTQNKEDIPTRNFKKTKKTQQKHPKLETDDFPHGTKTKQKKKKNEKKKKKKNKTKNKKKKKKKSQRNTEKNFQMFPPN